ncbi:hypothetical protein ACFS5L_22340 [Streptomyces phyllanthi]|uniref:hypothetical protein n=1 Tax=Streptomyces phyllanthi TaxID=1803180 RepID=UPI00188446D4|nr:hypothetical protein [Streptomyces phyllanthi]
MPWRHRALQRPTRLPGRGFCAGVIGELQRAFCGARFDNNFPLFLHYDVVLRVPEAGGRSTRTTRHTT